MSILTLLIIFFFIIWIGTTVVGWWEGVGNRYPIDSSPVAHLMLKTLLLVAFFPILVCAGLVFLVGIIFRG